MLDDFAGLEGCNEILNDTRPDVVAGIHRAYFAAGADAGDQHVRGEPAQLRGLRHRRPDRGAGREGRAARPAGCRRDGHPDRPRFVLGSIGPGTKLPTLGHETFRRLRDAYTEAGRGLLAGGCDAFVVETCQDLLQVKAAVPGLRRSMLAEGRRVPAVTHVTVETTGTMLLGSEIGAALTAIEPLGVDLIGLNCATGPAEMSEHLRTLSKHAWIPLSVMPNAGLPQLGPRGAEYPLTPDELAEALAAFVRDYGLRLVGCCGTTPAHVRARRRRDPVRHPGGAPSPSRAGRQPALRRGPVPPGHVRVDGGGADQRQRLEDLPRRDARRAGKTASRCASRSATGAPHRPQSTTSAATGPRTWPSWRTAGHGVHPADHARLHRAGRPARRPGALGGRSVVNSVNYEDGDGPGSRFQRTMALVREHGAAVVALCIDEEGQARTAEWKVRVADRLIAISPRTTACTSTTSSSTP